MRPVARLALIHAAANALLLWLGYYWLGLGEARMTTLLWSLVIALGLIASTALVYGAAFVYFSGAPAYRTALRNLGPLMAAALGALVIYYGLAWWAAYSPGPAATVASYLTLKLRKPVSPGGVLHVFDAALWLIRWVIVPVLLVPMLAAVASRGWSGFRVGRSKWLYWIVAPALLLGALWVPLRLLGWVPHVGSFSAEMASFVMRAVVAYLLFVAGWLGLAYVTSAGGRHFVSPSALHP